MIDNLKKKENIIPFILILIFLLKLTFFPNYFNGGGDNPGYWKIRWALRTDAGAPGSLTT